MLCSDTIVSIKKSGERAEKSLGEIAASVCKKIKKRMFFSIRFAF